MVRKKSGPGLKLDVPPLKDCDNCNGSGEFMGLYHEMPCDPCNATGSLHKETGEQVPPGKVCIGLRREIRDLRHLNQLLQKRINELEDPHAPATTRQGGKVRLD